MKTKKLFNILFLATLMVFSNYLKAQNCNSFYTLVNGNEYEMTSYDSKDNADGKTINKITKVETSAGITVATVETKTFNKKNEVEGTVTYTIKCEGTSMYMEMKSLMTPKSDKQSEGLDMKADADWMKLPQTLSVGMTLDDATGTITMYKDGTLFSIMKMSVTNRIVEGKKTITTSAGTFECYKITQNMEMTTTMMGMSFPVQIKTIEYVSAGVGSVRSETYDKDGKLMGYSLLTKVTKL
jgi:hypothetical protein